MMKGKNSVNSTENRNECIACASSLYNLEVRAIVAPWIRELTGFESRSVTYRRCKECNSGWIVESYSEEEMARLYRDYRGKKYLETRRNWEPTYTSHLNSSLDRGNEHLQLRKKALTELIESSRSNFSSEAKVVVDIGGGHGGVIPDWQSLKRKYVLDVSGVQTVEGVVSISGWDEIKEREVNLIMVCGILEHLANPENFLKKLASDSRKKRSSSVGTLIYFEVPSGTPFRPKYAGKLVLALSLSRFRITWKFYDRLTSRFRSHFPLRIAEHIQFFTLQGLTSLLQRSGFRVLGAEDYSYKQSLSKNQGIRFSSNIAIVAELI